MASLRAIPRPAGGGDRARRGRRVLVERCRSRSLAGGHARRGRARLGGRSPEVEAFRRTTGARVLAGTVVACAVVATLALLHHEVGLRALAPSDQDRSVEWSTALDQWRSAPLVGVGPDRLLTFRASAEPWRTSCTTSTSRSRPIRRRRSGAARPVRPRRRQSRAPARSLASPAVGALVCWAVAGRVRFRLAPQRRRVAGRVVLRVGRAPGKRRRKFVKPLVKNRKTAPDGAVNGSGFGQSRSLGLGQRRDNKLGKAALHPEAAAARRTSPATKKKKKNEKRPRAPARSTPRGRRSPKCAVGGRGAGRGPPPGSWRIRIQAETPSSEGEASRTRNFDRAELGQPAHGGGPEAQAAFVVHMVSVTNRCNKVVDRPWAGNLHMCRARSGRALSVSAW